MALLFGPFTPITGQIIEVDIPQDSTVVEVRNASPYDLWVSFSPQVPVVGRSLATGLYGQLVGYRSRKIITIPAPDANNSNRGPVWLYPFNPFSPTLTSQAGSNLIYVLSSADADEFREEAGIAGPNQFYSPEFGGQKFAPAAVWDLTLDSQHNLYGQLAVAPPTSPNPISATQLVNTGGTTGTVTIPGVAGQTLYISGSSISVNGSDILIASTSGWTGWTNKFIPSATAPLDDQTYDPPMAATGPGSGVSLTIQRAAGGALTTQQYLSLWGFYRNS